jgi:hypothetical protein
MVWYSDFRARGCIYRWKSVTILQWDHVRENFIRNSLLQSAVQFCYLWDSLLIYATSIYVSIVKMWLFKFVSEGFVYNNSIYVRSIFFKIFHFQSHFAFSYPLLTSPFHLISLPFFSVIPAFHLSSENDAWFPTRIFKKNIFAIQVHYTPSVIDVALFPSPYNCSWR